MQQDANITHNEANGSETKKQKGSGIMHDAAEASEMKDTEKGSETKQNNGHVTKNSSAVMDDGENERPMKATHIKNENVSLFTMFRKVSTPPQDYSTIKMHMKGTHG